MNPTSLAFLTLGVLTTSVCAQTPADANARHDKDIVEGKKTYRLNWSNDKDGAFAIIEYLKTL